MGIRFRIDRKDRESSAGKVALLWEDYKEKEFWEVAAYGAHLRELPEPVYCERFAACIQAYTAAPEEAKDTFHRAGGAAWAGSRTVGEGGCMPA